MKTYRERLIAGLKALGWSEDSTDKSSYAAFTHSARQNVKMFVGKAGALRLGRTATSSMSVGDSQHQTAKYLEVLEAAGGEEQ